MIPDNMIKKAKAAYINRCGKTCSHDSLTAALEAVVADIWDEGFEVGEFNGYAIGRDIETSEDTTNPYRASETK